MLLNEFIEKKLEERGLKWRALTEAGIGSMTVQNIRQGKPVKIKEVTKEKLANVLQCSIGDINAALAETTQVTPFGEEVRKNQEEPSVMQMVDKLDEMVKEGYPEKAEAGQEEEPEMKWYADKPKDAPEKVPVKREVLEELFPDDADETEGVRSDDFMDAVSAAATGAVEAYRQRLKDICLKAMAKSIPHDYGVAVVYADIGRALLEELAKK